MWGPRVIVITGSSGKTTTMHFIKSQLNEKARYSEKANSAFGIPFDILGLRRMTLLPSEWPLLFLKAPLMVFKKPYKETLYVVEADCDRPGEGKFLAQLVKPEVTIWLSLSRSHTANFESEGGNVEKVIAKEFGEFVKSTTGLVIINADNPFIVDASEQTKNVKSVSKKNMTKYEVKEDATAFTINSVTYRIPYLLPEETSYSIQSLTIVMEYLGLEVNTSFSHLILPPGRSSLFEGIKRTKIIDSSYNASLESVSAMLNLFKMYPTDKKWVVVGDMIEQGKYEKEEHEKLADLILQIELEKIVLVGPRVSQYA